MILLRQREQTKNPYLIEANAVKPHIGRQWWSATNKGQHFAGAVGRFVVWQLIRIELLKRDAACRVVAVVRLLRMN